MYFTKAMLLLLALHLCIGLQAQTSCTFTLEGRIEDKHGNPLVGAALLLSPGQQGKITNEHGRYAFDLLCAGGYRIRIQYVGYKDTSIVIQISEYTRRDFVLREQVTELTEIIIQHHDAANTAHAINFSVLGERQLAEAAGKTLGENLREIPGVTSLQTGPGIFKPVIHGVHGQRLLILNHGIRHEGQQWGAEHAPEIDPFIASSVTVIKDASAIKYGTDALGGVIVVNPGPLPQSDKLAGTFTTVLQSNGRSGTVSGMLEGGIKNAGGWGWRVQGTTKHGGDFETPDYVLTNTGTKELNFSAAAGYHKKKVGLDVFFSRFNSSLGILRGTAVSNLDDLVSAMERDTPLYTTEFSYRIQEPRQEVNHHLLKVNGHIRGKAGEWRLQYGLQRNNRKEYDLRIGGLSKIPAINLQLDTHTLDGEWETHHSERGTFSFGINAMHQSNHNIPGTQRIPFIPDFENATGGIFVTSMIHLPRWTFDAGLRYDYRYYFVSGFDFRNSFYSSSFDFNNVSASLGLKRKMTDEQTLKLSLSTSWRPPHVSELYSIGTHQSAAAIEYGFMLDPATNEVREFNDVSFSPEQALKVVASYEIGKEKLNMVVTPYVNYIFNYIFLRPEGFTRNIRGVYPYFRYDQTDALFIGADVDATWKIHRDISVSPKATFLRARDVVNNSYFLFIPSNRYAINVRYERPEVFGVRNLYVESETQLVSRQTFAPRVISISDIKSAQENGVDPFNGDRSIFDFAEAPDGYFLWSVAAGVSIKSKNTQFDIRLAGENLLNQRFREYTNRFRYYADDVGRNLVLSIKCIF